MIQHSRNIELLDPDCALATGAARIHYFGRFEHKEVGRAVGYGQVLYASRHDEHLTCFEHDGIMGTELHLQLALDAEEQFVLIFVLMPDELALELGELDLAVIDCASPAGAPALIEGIERLCDIDLLNHRDISGG